MKSNQQGWLSEYLDFRKNVLNELLSDRKKSSHPEHSLYRVIQPTGLMYGHSVEISDYPRMANLHDSDKMKVLLAESLISSSLLFHDKAVNTSEELSNLMSRTLESIANFYNRVFPEFAIPSKSFFGKRKSPLELAEKILDKRIERTTEFRGSFWSEFFNNSLLFLDVFIFGQWIHTNADRIVSDFFKYEKEELRFSLVKIIAAASHANKNIEFEERKLMDFFLQSAGLSADKKREALDIFENGIDLESINLPTNNSWLLKKFFLEMAILTIWADKKIEETENEFLRQFCHYLDFTDEDLENSMIAIEGFVLEHWEELGYLQNKQDYNQVSEKFIKRLAKLAENNKSRIIHEIRESQKLMDLLRKARAQELTEEERIDVQELMISVLRTIPTFVIISLPQRYLTLPILMKILPSTIFSESLDN